MLNGTQTTQNVLVSRYMYIILSGNFEKKKKIGMISDTLKLALGQSIILHDPLAK